MRTVLSQQGTAQDDSMSDSLFQNLKFDMCWGAGLPSSGKLVDNVGRHCLTITLIIGGLRALRELLPNGLPK